MSPARCETSRLNRITGQFETQVRYIPVGKQETIGKYVIHGTKTGCMVEEIMHEPGEELVYIAPKHPAGPNHEGPFLSLGGTIFITPERQKSLLQRILDIIRNR